MTTEEVKKEIEELVREGEKLIYALRREGNIWLWRGVLCLYIYGMLRMMFLIVRSITWLYAICYVNNNSEQ